MPLTPPYVVGGPRRWEGGMDSEGYREYKVVFFVATLFTQGPAVALQASGLPAFGSLYYVGLDLDLWAYRKLQTTMRPAEEPKNEQWQFWEVECTFSSKPNLKWCKDQQIDDPLLQPPRISGSFTNDREESLRDRFGRDLKNGCHEQLRGPQVEFDVAKPSVTVEQNVADLQLPLLTVLQNRVNDDYLWGVAPRCVKFTCPSWELKFYGTCFAYYTRTLKFDINPDTWDRTLLDEGTKVLNGHWSNGAWVNDNVGGSSPDKKNPFHFIRRTDFNGNPCKGLLDKDGNPAGAAVDGTVLINTTPLTTGINNPYTVALQPTQNSIVHAVIDNNSAVAAAFGSIHIDGTGTAPDGTNDVAVSCDIPFSTDDNGASIPFVDVYSTIKFNHINTVTVVTFITTSSGTPTIKFYAQDSGSPPNKIYVSRYAAANLLLLGIPTTL